MKNDTMPEILFTSPGDNAAAQRMSRLVKQGLIRPLYRGIYTSSLDVDDQSVVTRNWSKILSHWAPGCVLSHRSAFELVPIDGAVYLSKDSGAREFELPGLSFKAMVKPKLGPILSATRTGALDVKYQDFYVASQARAYLESLTPDSRLLPRQLAKEAIEEKLELILRLKGARALNSLRDDAREVSELLGLTKEFTALNKIIGSLLGTHDANFLKSRIAKARAQGLPYDSERLEMFEQLAGQLKNTTFPNIVETTKGFPARANFAFVEAYFSNYIEGTTFTVEEAQDIVFNGKIIPSRSEDSHDVKGTFDAILRDPFYSKPPNNPDELLEWIKKVNAMVMQSRTDRMPGQFKLQANQAGNTLFVLPELVPETLRQSWELIDLLNEPMQKALFSMFLISEIHPFTDGNGRTARILMNAFLSKEDQGRIIIPTVFREDYLLSLKALSHQKQAQAYISAMQVAQKWANQLNFETSIEEINQQLSACNAKQEDTRMFRLLSPKTLKPIGVD